jgi:hypothetical protein
MFEHYFLLIYRIYNSILDTSEGMPDYRDTFKVSLYSPVNMMQLKKFKQYFKLFKTKNNAEHSDN